MWISTMRSWARLLTNTIEETGPWSCKHKEINLANRLNKLGSRFFPSVQKECSPAHTLIWFGEIWIRNPADIGNAQISELHSCDIINLYCLKPPNIWWFVWGPRKLIQIYKKRLGYGVKADLSQSLKCRDWKVKNRIWRGEDCEKKFEVS